MSWTFWQTLSLLVSQCGSTEVWPQPKHKASQWLISWAAPVTAFLPTSQALQTGEKQEQDGHAHPVVQSWNPLDCLLSKRDTEQMSSTEDTASIEPFEKKKNEHHWWAALQMEKLSIGIELNKYSSLSVSKMPPPAQPRKRRKPAWEPAHSLVWGCSRQEWSLIRCHFPYAGHHGKIKVTEINFVGLQKDEQNFPDPLMILQC